MLMPINEIYKYSGPNVALIIIILNFRIIMFETTFNTIVILVMQSLEV